MAAAGDSCRAGNFSRNGAVDDRCWQDQDQTPKWSNVQATTSPYPRFFLLSMSRSFALALINRGEIKFQLKRWKKKTRQKYLLNLNSAWNSSNDVGNFLIYSLGSFAKKRLILLRDFHTSRGSPAHIAVMYSCTYLHRWLNILLVTTFQNRQNVSRNSTYHTIMAIVSPAFLSQISTKL